MKLRELTNILLKLENQRLGDAQVYVVNSKSGAVVAPVTADVTDQTYGMGPFSLKEGESFILIYAE